MDKSNINQNNDDDYIEVTINSSTPKDDTHYYDKRNDEFNLIGKFDGITENKVNQFDEHEFTMANFKNTTTTRIDMNGTKIYKKKSPQRAGGRTSRRKTIRPKTKRRRSNRRAKRSYRRR